MIGSLATDGAVLLDHEMRTQFSIRATPTK
jgi:hypothetical protein